MEPALVQKLSEGSGFEAEPGQMAKLSAILSLAERLLELSH